MRFHRFDKRLSLRRKQSDKNGRYQGTHAFSGGSGTWTAIAWKRIAVGFAAIGVVLLASTIAKAEVRPDIPVIRLEDISGQVVNAFRSEETKAFVFLFVSVDCPICNAYAPEFRKLDGEFGPAGIAFRAVYPNREDTAQVIRKHVEDFEYPFPALRDPKHLMCRAAGVRVTPEAAIFVPGQGWVYRGRIDNRYAELGDERTVTTQFDLRMALQDVLEGRKPATSKNRAIGCSISPLP